MSDAIEYAYNTTDTDHEAARLAHQSRMSDDGTRRWLTSAGVRPGARVAEVGCGSGDVTAIAAELVGENGVVYAFDRDPNMVELTTRRMEQAGLRHVSVEQRELHDLPLDPGTMDAVFGRLVLMYQPDPSEAVRNLARHVRPSGAVAFMEFSNVPLGLRQPGDEFATASESPLLHKAFNWVHLAVMRSGTQPLMGLRLLETFAAAGLRPSLDIVPVPWISTDFAAAGAAQVRGVLPAVVALGIATETEVDIDTFEDRLRAELGPYTIVDAGSLIGAWATKP